MVLKANHTLWKGFESKPYTLEIQLPDSPGISFYGGTRQWMFVEVDGTIYKIMLELIQNVVYCLDYDRSFYGKKNCLR